jgi:DNA-directed RNA polymerase subunit RPC12/RpoP
MTVECPVCEADSDLLWRCSECGKPFDGDGDSAGRGQEVTR